MDFSEGLAAINVGAKPDSDWYPSGGKWGYIDKTGKFVIEPRFDGAEDFSEGLAPVKLGDKWGYIDKTGKLVIKRQFDYTGAFSEGLALVEVVDKTVGPEFGYIGKTGKYAINQQFGDAFGFSGGLAWVRIDDKRGYIDNTGKYVWEPSK